MQFKSINQQNYYLVADTYKEGIATGHATFETEVPDWSSWDQSHLKHSRIFALDQGQYIGWAALSPVSGRCVYGGVAEVSIYIKSSEQNKSYGKAILIKLIEESEEQGIWTLQAGIFPENIASLSLHKNCGFKLLGTRDRIGRMKNGFWRDVCILERRSARIGADKKNILVLCTGNSCRSQMAEGYLRHFAGNKANVYSAGLENHGLNSKAVFIMKEDGIDISYHTSNTIDEYTDIPMDIVLTVCDHANEHCPVFPSAQKRFHYNFKDPSKLQASETEILNAFRDTRNEIKKFCQQFINDQLGQQFS